MNGRREDFLTTLEEDFRALFNANYGDVLAYAVRRCGSRQDAEDVVAETFAVAWRRMSVVPEGIQRRLWLFVTARGVLANLERTRRRQRSLVEKIQDALPRPSAVAADEAPDQHRIHDAMATLTSEDREALQLHVWEELSAEEIAIVLDITTSAVWKRLQRARTRLGRALNAQMADGAHPSKLIPILGKEPT